MAYIGAGAFGLQSVTAKVQTSLTKAKEAMHQANLVTNHQAALAPAAAAVAPSSGATGKPWYMKPSTWLLGGALALGVYFMLKPSAMRANPYPPPGKRTHCRHCDRPTRSLSPDGYCGHCMLPSEDTPPAPVRVSVRPRRRRSR